MSTTILVAIIVSFVSPVVLALVNAWLHRKDKEQEAEQRRAEKQQDWDRQDAVAEQAEKAAALLLDENRKVAIAAARQGAQLKQIHTLVNSNLDASKRAELVALEGQATVLKRLMDVNAAAGKAPTDDDLAELDAVKLAAEKLRSELAERVEKGKVADAERIVADHEAAQTSGPE